MEKSIHSPKKLLSNIGSAIEAQRKIDKRENMEKMVKQNEVGKGKKDE